MLIRAGQTAGVLLAAALVSFLLFRFVGDPVNNIVGQGASVEERAATREALGLNDPAIVQFSRFVGRAVQGEFGVSYRFSQPVADLIGQRLPATAELTLAAMLVALGLGVPLGMWTAIKPRGVLTQTLLTLSLIGVALPTFLIGIVLILVFSVWLGWLPAFGRGAVTNLGWWTTGLLTTSGLRALILPALTLGLFQMTLIMRMVRSEMLEILRSDHIRFSRARGLRRPALIYRHAFRNALTPLVTIVGLQFGNVFAFSIVVETVFQWPGLGLLVIQAIQFADVPLLAAYLLLVALTFALINLAVDLVNAVIDPRIRQEAL